MTIDLQGQWRPKKDKRCINIFCIKCSRGQLVYKLRSRRRRVTGGVGEKEEYMGKGRRFLRGGEEIVGFEGERGR